MASHGNLPENFTEHGPIEGSSDRVFGFVITAALCVFGLLPLIKGHPIKTTPLMIAPFFLVPALVYPKILNVPNKLWMKFGLLLSKIMNPIIMGILFYIVVTPIGLLLRLSGKDLLRKKLEPDSKSYWIVKSKVPGASMKNQF